ncbi:unnamed protein product [Ceratitis capitata]|nr:unnamed protein product [Ceratitis capitata]
MRSILLKGTAREDLSIKPVSLKAIMTLSTRPLIDGGFSRNLLTQFLAEILSVPALVYHLNIVIPQCIENFNSMQILKRFLQSVEDADWFSEFTKSMPGTKVLAFLGNIVNLFTIDSSVETRELAYPLFTNATTLLLEKIPNTVSSKGVFTQWHELLGWHTPSLDSAQNQNVALIKKQFHFLWGHRCIKVLLVDTLRDINATYERVEFQPPSQASTSNIIRRALDRGSSRGTFNRGNRSWRRLDCAEVEQVSRVSAMFYAALNTLSQLRLDILTGICYNDNVLYGLWLLLTSLGPHCGMKEFLELLKQENALRKPQVAMLMLFCDSMTHYVT